MQTVSAVKRLVFVTCLAHAGIAIAEEPADAEKLRDDKLAVQRFELMQQRVGVASVKSAEDGFPEQFELKPIFRYSDPARGYVAAAVWKLGETGRPRALLTTELHRSFSGTPRIVYEFLSLTPTRFAVVSKDIRWSPEGTALEFKAIPNAPDPDDSPQRRLLQMRALARRFAASELVGKEKSELRLLPQPVDRYIPVPSERADAGVFLLTFGTNPELVLLIESDGKAWTFAAGRLAGATKITLTIDGTTAWESPPLRYGANQPYTASNAAADIPGIAPDGSELKP